MPKAPDTDCPFCGGAGVINDPALTKLNRPGFPQGAPVACMCTVTDTEITAALAGIVTDMLRNSKGLK